MIYIHRISSSFQASTYTLELHSASLPFVSFYLNHLPINTHKIKLKDWKCSKPVLNSFRHSHTQSYFIQHQPFVSFSLFYLPHNTHMHQAQEYREWERELSSPICIFFSISHYLYFSPLFGNLFPIPSFSSAFLSLSLSHTHTHTLTKNHTLFTWVFTWI